MIHRKDAEGAENEDFSLAAQRPANEKSQRAFTIELKACERIEPIHRAQLLTYLKLSGLGLALLSNFNISFIRNGLVCIVNELKEEAPF